MHYKQHAHNIRVQQRAAKLGACLAHDSLPHICIREVGVQQQCACKCACEMCSEYNKAKLDIACMVSWLSGSEFQNCWLHTMCCSLT